MKQAGPWVQAAMLEPQRPTFDDIPDTAIEHGEIFTRRWIVDLILDLAGYSADKDLASMAVVEPACGAGAFLGPIIERLSASCKAHGHKINEAVGAIRSLDLLDRNVEITRRLARKVLLAEGWSAKDATTLSELWVRAGDYLLVANDMPTDFVIGNPPYLRLEDVPANRMKAYRSTCQTMVGRADIYVGFFEVGLRSLRQGGVLAFICADRWMRNQYGRDLRQMVADGYSVDLSAIMHDVDAFEQTVSAYPAITVIRRAKQGPALVVDTNERFGPNDALALATWSKRRNIANITRDSFAAAKLPHWFETSDSWPSGSPAQLALIEDLNDRFRPLEDPETGTRVGIGVATGADSVFVTGKNAPIEIDRLLPLSMVRDTTTGELRWSGNYLVNPWGPDGRLVDLGAYPQLREYLDLHGQQLRGRHVAGKVPTSWYRTIDKVDHSLTERGKLLFPDMKLKIHPVLDEGGFYPHHNLYYVVSRQWDLRVLGGLLLSRVAQAFVDAYAVKMRGGTLRFQAQYLRRIRVPRPADICATDRAALVDAFDRRDVAAATVTAIRVYGIDVSMADLPDGSTEIRRRRS